MYFALTFLEEVVRYCLALCSLPSLAMSASAPAACRATTAGLSCGGQPLLLSSSWSGSSPANHRILANAATARGEEISSSPPPRTANAVDPRTVRPRPCAHLPRNALRSCPPCHVGRRSYDARA